MTREGSIQVSDALTHPYLESIISEQNKKLEDVIKELADVKYALDQSAIVAITDQKGSILYVNKHFCRISQYTRQELLSQDHRILNSGYHSANFFKDMWATIGSGQVWRAEVRNRAKDGTFYWVDTTIVPLLNDQGKPYQYVSIRYDITLRKQMEEELRKSEEMYRLITENSSDLISIIDDQGKFLYVSPSHQSLLGHTLSKLGATTLTQWVHEKDQEALRTELNLLVAKRKLSAHLEFRLQTVNGKYRNMETKINLILNQSSETTNLVLVMRDITDRKKSEQMIYHLAYHDTLTDLPNRRLFMNRLRKEVEQAKSFSTQFALLFLDLDRFKYVNDSWGHEAGDLVLIEASQRVKSTVRSGDLVARLGGDEFTVLLTDVSDRKEVEEIAQRIQASLQKPVEIAGQLYTISCSMGITLFPEDGKEANELLSRADIALYAVKEQGRSGFTFFHADMEERSLERILLENELRKAIELEQFKLEYQPKIDLTVARAIGMEALVRWNHPDLGKIPPNKFIPLAEETGLIIPLGEWILRQACRQNKEWQNQGFPALKVSVNVSARQLAQGSFVSKVEEILKETELEPRWLELEVTESVFADLDNAVVTLQEIRDLGVQISIDDFGTGYSSFSYIKHLPVDTLKIDASFIRDIDRNEESQAIVKAVLTLAHTLGIDAIAEGIESTEQLIHLNESGCAQGQGYLFSKPLSVQDFEEYLKEYSKK